LLTADDVDRLALLVEVHDGGVNEAVAVHVEVVGRDDVGDFDDGVFFDQDGAEQAGFGFDILRWDAAGGDFGGQDLPARSGELPFAT
jgi:hypothetical protein